MGTIIKTYSVDEELYTKFNEICEIKKIKKSEILQNAITNFIIDNFDIDENTKYRIISNNNAPAIHIKEKDGEFLLLSNGNKIHVFDFEQIYEPVDVDVENVLEHLTKNKLNLSIDMTPVDDDFLTKPFFNPKIAEDLVKKSGIFNGTKEYKIYDTWIDERTKHIKDERSAFIEVEEKTNEEKAEELLEKWRIDNAKKWATNKHNQMISGITGNLDNANLLKEEVNPYKINLRINEIKDRVNRMPEDYFDDIKEKTTHMQSFLTLLLSDMVNDFYLEISYNGGDDIEDEYIISLSRELVCDDVKNIINKLYNINVHLNPIDVAIVKDKTDEKKVI